MTSQMRLLASASLLAVAALGASPAYAAGTASGSTITNNVTLSYQVGGVNQNNVTASNTFTVDRKINLTVAEVGTTTTSVSPGQAVAVTTFSVTNTSNAALDFQLALTQLVGGAAPHGGTDSFDISSPGLYVDTNTNGTYDAGTDLAATYLDEIAADTSRTVFAVGGVPLGLTNGAVAAVVLTATAREAGASGSMGAAITETAGANTSGVDTVFADVADALNTARNGAHVARDDYTVAAASLSVTKLSYVISDPLNGVSANAKMIPGAVVEYCIAVSNAALAAAADNVSISDTLPTETTYVSSFGILTGGTSNGTTCTGGSTGSGSITGSTVSATLGTINGGSSTTVRFQVTVN